MFQLSLILAVLAAVPTLYPHGHGACAFRIAFWRSMARSGSLLVILMPAIAIQFVASTLSGAFASTGTNILAAYWKTAAVVGTVGMFLYFSGRLDVRGIFFAMMITDSILYLAYYALIWVAIRHPREVS
ncbi:MAG: hypothetical protein R3E68_15330 [Burkholderiaceae bacterium]